MIALETTSNIGHSLNRSESVLATRSGDLFASHMGTRKERELTDEGHA